MTRIWTGRVKWKIQYYISTARAAARPGASIISPCFPTLRLSAWITMPLPLGKRHWKSIWIIIYHDHISRWDNLSADFNRNFCSLLTKGTMRISLFHCLKGNMRSAFCQSKLPLQSGIRIPQTAEGHFPCPAKICGTSKLFQCNYSWFNQSWMVW